MLYSVKAALVRQNQPLVLVDAQLESLVDMLMPCRQGIPNIDQLEAGFGNLHTMTVENHMDIDIYTEFGNSAFIKRIWIPSWDPMLEILKFVMPWMPNCKLYLLY